jgi:hypothetical protein
MLGPNKAGDRRRVTFWAIPFQGHKNSALCAPPADIGEAKWLVSRGSIYRPTSAW